MTALPTRRPPRADRRRQAPGPAAHLMALPDDSELALASPAAVDAHLEAVETARQRQLDEIAEGDHDPVAVAYRATVERILEEVRAARGRVAVGRYGVCARCGLPIAALRLQLRPWTATCARCAEVDRP